MTVKIKKKFHPKAIKKAEEYANTPYNYGVFEVLHYEFGDAVGKDEDDKELIKRAFLAGYAEARKDTKLNWFDVQRIIGLALAESPDLRFDDSQCLYESVAEKFNEEFFGRHYY